MSGRFSLANQLRSTGYRRNRTPVELPDRFGHIRRFRGISHLLRL